MWVIGFINLFYQISLTFQVGLRVKVSGLVQGLGRRIQDIGWKFYGLGLRESLLKHNRGAT